VPVFNDWGIEVPASIEESLGRASATTKTSAIAGPSHRQSIERWRKVLTPEQVEKILRVVRSFGMDFYTEDSEPDYDRLNRVVSS
jgi:hypothetical protein